MDGGGMGGGPAESTGGTTGTESAGQATSGPAATTCPAATTGAAKSNRVSADGAPESGALAPADHANAPADAARAPGVFPTPTDPESIRGLVAVARQSRIECQHRPGLL